MTYDLRPMLATPSTATRGRRGIEMSTLVGTHAFDEKIDGVRALMVIEDHQIKALSNRSGVSRMGTYPDLDPEYLPDCVLDGEIVASQWQMPDPVTPGATPVLVRSFEATAIRDKRARPAAQHLLNYPVKFIAFDILYWDGQDVRSIPWSQRRALLEVIIDPILGHSITTSRYAMPLHGNNLLLAEQIEGEGGEGVIAKDVNGRYHPGRHSSWVKFKNTHSITCVAVGYEPGTGSRKDFGAMRLALVGNHGPVEVGRVGTGFSVQDITTLKAMLDKGKPFPVEIECLNVTKSGQLRFPVYKGLRTDLSVVDATLDQLDTVPAC